MTTKSAIDTAFEEDLDGPDPDFAQLSADASRAAVERAFAAGLSVVYMEGGRFYRRFPDGRVSEIPDDEMQALREGRSWP